MHRPFSHYHQLFSACAICAFAASQAPAVTLVSFRPELRDLQGQPMQVASLGDHFRVQVFVDDVRTTPEGVYSAYADMAFDSAIVTHIGTPQIGSGFPQSRTDFQILPGLLDEIGGVSDLVPSSTSTALLFEQEFIASSVGTASFRLGASDLIHHEVSLFGLDRNIRLHEMHFGESSLTIVPEPTVMGIALQAMLLVLLRSFRSHETAS